MMGSILIRKIIFIICATTVVMVQSRKVHFRTHVQDEDHIGANGDHRFLLLLGGLQNGRKSIDANTLARARILYNALTKKFLRQEGETQKEIPEADTKNDDATLVENELTQSLNKKSSAVQEKPYVQHKGKNDFLVFKAGVKDPFVTVIPNDIYYNVEKRCVNWLDDCNERGLRARILHRVQSPFR